MGECGSGVRFGQYVTIGCARNIKIKKNVTFGRGCELYACGGTLTIESNCKFNSNVLLNASVAGHISFGKNCILGPGVILRSSNHINSDLNIPIMYQGHEGGCITIGNNVWIGAGAIILPNVKIGDGVIVGAGSVVTKSFSANQVIGGITKLIENVIDGLPNLCICYCEANQNLCHKKFVFADSRIACVTCTVANVSPLPSADAWEPTTNLIS